MTPAEVEATLDELLRLPAETEWVEFKEAKNGYDLNRIREYFSALSNEANPGNQDSGWLVFGVEDKSRAVVGSQFRSHRKDLDHLKEDIAAQASPRELVEGCRSNLCVQLSQRRQELRRTTFAIEPSAKTTMRNLSSVI